jgi:dienelactone hydrolase
MSSRSTASARRTLGLVVAVAVVAVTALASTPPKVEAQATGCPASGTTLADFGDPGPFPTAKQEDANHTYYFPSELGSRGCTRHPVIVWGNGTWTNPTVYDQLLTHFASHGFVVAAANTSNAGSGIEMRQGLDNLTTFNNTAGNRFNQKLDLTQVGATGHSQGGGGALEAVKDQRIKTTAPMAPFLGSQTGFQPTDTALFFSGRNDTWLPPAGVKARYDGVSSPAAYAEHIDANHFVMAATAGDFRAPLTAWMRWHLMGDANARNMFIGATCGMCNDAKWPVFETNTALEALGTTPPTTNTSGPGTSGPGTSGPGSQDCVTATNAQHAQAGRAWSFLIFSFSRTTNRYLGLTWATTSLRRGADGSWEQSSTAC